MPITKHYLITKYLPYFLSFLFVLEIFMTLGAPTKTLQKALWTPKTKEQRKKVRRKWACPKSKSIYPFHSQSAYLVQFEWFLCHWMHQVEGYMSLSSKRNGRMSTYSGLFDTLSVWWLAYHLTLLVANMPYVFTYFYIVVM
jgi:hypothetical protein